MDNETNDAPEWGWYWSRYIQGKAGEIGLSVQTTEMWDAHNLLDGEHAATFDHPEIYSFVDVSQNNHRPANEHWEHPQVIRQRLIASGEIRPMNSVKIYGANSGRYGSTRDAQERFWRNILGGLASSRFHRPQAGLGLSSIVQAHIRSMRLFAEELDIFRSEPHNDLLANRSWNEAYCTARPGAEYGVFFPDGGNVLLDVSATEAPLTARWLEIRACRWTGPRRVIQREGPSQVRLVTPREEGYWAVVVKAVPIA
jgi:hypothetical protein